MKLTFKKLSLFLLTISILTVSCTSNNKQEPPVLPSAESMKVDITEMDSVSGKSKARRAESHFNTALMSAGIAKIILDANLIIPRALIRAAHDQKAESAGNKEWEWNYSTAANGQQFGVQLTALVESKEKVVWNFFVTNTAAGIENQLFFSGTSTRDATEGSWTYYSLQSGNKVSELSWEKSENSALVAMEVLSDRNNNLGDSIRYTFDGTMKSVVYTDVSEGETTTISYNVESMAGFIISPNYNGGAKSCWDENLNNTTCTS